MDKIVHFRQVIHLQFISNGENFYFGSIQAIYDHLTREQVGIAAQTLYNQWKEGVYQNDKVIIRKGRLIQKKNRNESQQ